MKKLVLKTTIQVYDDATELSKSDQSLLKLAHKSLKHSYSPYSKFKVSASVLLNNGKKVFGTNQENAAYSVCLCAERTALSNASSRYPKEPIQAIAVTARSLEQVLDRPVSPCGPCRQFICEMENRYKQPIRLILQGETGPIYVLESCKSILPLGFDSSFL